MFGYSHLVKSFLLSDVVVPVSVLTSMLCANLRAQTISEINREYSNQWWGHGLPIHHLLGNVIPATVGLVYINLQPEYELPNSTLYGQFWKFGKIGVGGTVLPSYP